MAHADARDGVVISQNSPGVLLVGNHAPPFGGVPRHVGALAAHLAAEGWRVHVLADVCDRAGTFTVDGYTVHVPTRADKVRSLFRGLPRQPWHRIRTALLDRWPHSTGDFARAAKIRELVLEHDLRLISAYHLLKPGLSAAWVSEDLNIPLVTTVFGEIYAQPEEHRQRLPHLQAILERSALRLSCSRHCADSVAWLGINLPVDVLYYGVDVHRFRPETRESGQTDACRVAFVGRMVPEMGLDTLLDALPGLLADERIHVIVAGARGALTDAALVAAERYQGRVQVRVDVPDDALPEIYRNADVVVAPSVNARACLGLAIAEGMASGLPVVGCHVGGTAEVIEDGRTGTLVAAHDSEGLAQAVLRYADDPGLRRDHGQHARERAEEMFDLADTNRRCRDMFASLL